MCLNTYTVDVLSRAAVILVWRAISSAMNYSQTRLSSAAALVSLCWTSSVSLHMPAPRASFFALMTSRNEAATRPPPGKRRTFPALSRPGSIPCVPPRPSHHRRPARLLGTLCCGPLPASLRLCRRLCPRDIPPPPETDAGRPWADPSHSVPTRSFSALLGSDSAPTRPYSVRPEPARPADNCSPLAVIALSEWHP